uniref:Trigger factor n=1 Tax=Candidatus Kentrum sp. TUN TaxID=2126343 RepID=A0A450ZAM8_9GAMM|nr:MAG: trigger factor [Candidatus Kentron sp. TUN]
MHVTVDITNDVTDGFNRRMQVEIPEDRIVNDVNEQLRSLIATTRVPGFRPGKVPLRVLARRYGREARDDVVKRLLYSSFQKALTQESLQLANGPEISEMNSDLGKGLTYTAVFDVYPDVDNPVVETLKIRRPVTEITEEDVDRMMETLRKECKIWSRADRPAIEGDRVTVDFEGVVTAKPEDTSAETDSPDATSSSSDSSESVSPESLKGSKVPVELGAGMMVGGFEDGLIGANSGDERILEVTFPEQYYKPGLAGRPVTFTVQVHSVESASLPDTDEEFAKHFGVQDGNMDTFRAETRKDMESKLEFALQAEINKRVIDALLTDNPIAELPRNVVMREANAIAEKKHQEFASIGIDSSNLDMQPANFEEQAHRQIALNLLLSKLMSMGNIIVDSDRVRKRIETVASGYQDPKKVIAWYYEDERRLMPVQMMVLQDQVVEWVLEHADVTDEQTSFDALLNPLSDSTSDSPDTEDTQGQSND